MLLLSALLFFVAVLLFITFKFASSQIERDVIDIRPDVPQQEPRSSQPPIFLSSVPPTMAQKYTAVSIVMIMLAAFALMVPIADYDGPNIPAFPPVTDALLAVMYFVTGFIITGQYLRTHTWSLLVLASGYYYQSTMAVIHMMTFPGFFLNLQPLAVTPWTYTLWQGGFPLFVITYAIIHGRQYIPTVAKPLLALAVSGVAIVTTCVAVTFAIFKFQTLFPVMLVGIKYTDAFNSILGPTILAGNLTALLMLWLRGNSVLDVWLMVSQCASVLYVTIASIIGNERFDVSYYAGRMYGVIAAALVLGALLEEMNRLYASVFAFMERREVESEAKYRAVFDTTIDAIIVINQVGIVKSFNHAAERMFGYADEEVIEQNIKMLMPEPYHSAHDHYLQAYHDTGIRKIIGSGREVQGKRKDGTILTLDLAVTEWLADEEQLFTGILRDVSERKRLEQQLIQSQKMEAIGQLSGGMAHDFNNILGVVIGNLDMLAERFPQAPIELSEAITASVAGADLVQRLLAFSRRQPLLPKLIALNELVEDLMPLVRRIIGSQIEMETSYDTDLWPVIADPAQFENALLNLAINARDAMPDGGRLAIEVRSQVIDDHSATDYDVPTGTYTTLVVTDTGTGIPPEIIERVFDPFFTTKPPGMGSGLGLSMVFGYAKQSGGVVRIYSEVGTGTSVRLYLPSIINGEIDITTLLDVDNSDLHGNERILVVEDMASARTVAQRILVSLGYNVQVARDGTEAMLFFDSGETFDLLFTDIIMPGMTGVTLAHIVKKRYPLIHILFTSGFSRTPAEEVRHLDADSITKPYRKIDLAILLRKIFNKR